MVAVRNRDRVMLSGLNRILLSRVARLYGAVYVVPRAERFKWYWSLRGRFIRKLGTRATTRDQLGMTLHVMHYMIRRAHNLRTEWGLRDMIRQQYLLNIGDLIKAIMDAQGSGAAIDICLCAMSHIELDYGDVVRTPRQTEILDSYLTLVPTLARNGYEVQAQRLVAILTVAALRGLHLRLEQVESAMTLWPTNLVDVYRQTCAQARRSVSWMPQSYDPWEHRYPMYSVLRSMSAETFWA